MQQTPEISKWCKCKLMNEKLLQCVYCFSSQQKDRTIWHCCNYKEHRGEWRLIIRTHWRFNCYVFCRWQHTSEYHSTHCQTWFHLYKISQDHLAVLWRLFEKFSIVCVFIIRSGESSDVVCKYVIAYISLQTAAVWKNIPHNIPWRSFQNTNKATLRQKHTKTTMTNMSQSIKSPTFLYPPCSVICRIAIWKWCHCRRQRKGGPSSGLLTTHGAPCPAFLRAKSYPKHSKLRVWISGAFARKREDCSFLPFLLGFSLNMAQIDRFPS